MRSYLIKEIFGPTLQGEGSAAGTPVYFVRFGGCNRWTGREKDRAVAFCTFCDTDFYGGTKMTASDILSKLSDIRVRSVRTVVISGGEPTLQLDRSLLESLRGAGYLIHLETNGSNDILPYVDLLAHVSVSPKQPLAETKLRWATDLKLLYPWIHPEITADQFQEYKTAHRFLQPVDSPEYSANLKATMEALHSKHEMDGYRLSLQLHKILGVQ
jgi:organic radical activating enzyme